jgi:hypothetical protein
VTNERLQAILAIGAIGAALALVNLLGTTGGLIGVGLMALTTVVSAPAAPQPGDQGLNWWALIAGGTAIALAGVLLAIAVESAGGLLTAIGGGMVIVGVAFGMP